MNTVDYQNPKCVPTNLTPLSDVNSGGLSELASWYRMRNAVLSYAKVSAAFGKYFVK
jgi:hypothetical protein